MSTRKIAVTATLLTPFLSPWIIKTVAAIKYDWIYYGNYNSLISLTFLVSAVAAFALLKKTGKIFGIGLAIAIIYTLIGIFLPSSRCEEYLILRTNESAKPKTQECD
jgi:membrane-associated HD superfamily phosphohydrolase